MALCELSVLSCVGFRTKDYYFQKFFLPGVGNAGRPKKLTGCGLWFRAATRSTSNQKGGPRAAFPLSLLDLLDDRAFARLNHICPVVALDIPILAQRRRFPIDLIGEGADLHGIRQALPDPGARRRGTAGGALFYPGRTSMLANDLAIPVGEGCPVRCRGGRGRSARAREHVDHFVDRESAESDCA